MGIKKVLEELKESYPEIWETHRIENVQEIHLKVESEKVIELCHYFHQEKGMQLLSLFGNDERSLPLGAFTINYCFGDREKGVLVHVLLPVTKDTSAFPSVTGEVPGAAYYEREIKEMYGLEPEGHPDSRPLVLHGNWPEGVFPLRKDFKKETKVPFASREMTFKKVGGEGVFEIPVGPVHAGIIEPGHFRFSVAGEPIINLEAQLGFVHKGIEKMAEGMSFEKGLYLSERISGDETFANSLAYCMAVEKLGGIVIPKRAKYMRVLFAELERLTAHLGDLAGICLDVAYGFACFQFRMMRGWSYQIADELCGMRFLRSVNQIGGVRKDFLKGKEQSIIKQLQKIEKELEDTWHIIRGNSMFADRVENTGIVTEKIARDLNAVGPGGRAAGLIQDVRKDFPYSIYGELTFDIPHFSDGDVNARMKVKLKECHESIKLMIEAIEGIHGSEYKEELGNIEAYKTAFALVEAPRGEAVHFLMSGEKNTIYRYKVRTPSFCNWPVVCHAVQGNIVPDFPLINKSFNLSYAGNDL